MAKRRKGSEKWKMRHWLLHRLRNWRTIYFIVAKLPMLASTRNASIASAKKILSKLTVGATEREREMEKTIRLFNVVQLSICLDCILWHDFLFYSSLRAFFSCSLTLDTRHRMSYYTATHPIKRSRWHIFFGVATSQPYHKSFVSLSQFLVLEMDV